MICVESLDVSEKTASANGIGEAHGECLNVRAPRVAFDPPALRRRWLRVRCVALRAERGAAPDLRALLPRFALRGGGVPAVVRSLTRT